MKLMLGNTPVKKMMIHNDTQDATMVASDLQAGVTCYAKGQKVTGTGKSFSFATYGKWKTNFSDIIPTVINTILISGTDHSVRMTIPMNDMVTHDFTTTKKMAEVTIDGVVYPITVCVLDGELMIDCEKTIDLQIFAGKDEYV